MTTARPVGLYLETSVLQSMPIDLAGSALLELKAQCEDLRLPVFVPELCVNELVHHRKTAVQDAIRQAERGVAHVTRYLDKAPVINWGKDAETISTEVEARFRGYLKQYGIETIPTADVPLARLLDMAVRKVRPFEEKREKGFRDSVILFSVLEHARSRPGYHVLVSGDGVFRHNDVMLHARQAGVDLRVVDSVGQAVETLKKFVSQTMTTWLERRSQELTNFLLSHKEEIQRHIKEHGEFTSTFFSTENFLSLGLAGHVHSIEDIELLEIVNARPGTLPNDVEQARVQISFGVKLKFVLSISKPFLLNRSPGLRVGKGPTDTPERIFSMLPDERVERSTITKVVNVEGSVVFKEPDTYSDLELRDVSGYTLSDMLSRGY